MIKGLDQLTNFDMEQFSSNLEEIKQEILAHSDSNDFQNEDDVVLEVIKVIQEEISKRNGKVKKKDVASDVKFLAYVNLFHTIMNGNLEEDDNFDDIEFEEYDEEEFEEEEK